MSQEPKHQHDEPTHGLSIATCSVRLAKTIIGRDTHKWRWHATGAGLGWVCDGECDGQHRYTGDDNPPPKYGCAKPLSQNKEV